MEVTHALRGLESAQKIPPRTASEAIAALRLLRAKRYRVEPFLPRIWQLRHNLTVYDAAYVALAESLDAPLVTADSKFDTPSVTRLITVEVVG